MYVPEHFAADDSEALIAKLARRFAGVFVSVDADAQPLASHMPILWDAKRHIARGHLARANGHWKLATGRGLIVLVGTQAYVSPSFYPSKAQHGKVVPTWNYEAVHLSGAVEWFDDPVRLKEVVADLSVLHEEGRVRPWSIEEAPNQYVEAMLRGIVGIEMRVEKVEAKRKLSQNKSAADFEGVMKGLDQGDPAARELAALMGATRASSDAPDGN